MELYKKHRPKKLSELIGQEDAVAVLKDLIGGKRIPHAVRLEGPSGTGKTTVARILKKVVGCSDIDFFEINAADFKGIDTVRDIRRTMGLAAMGGKSRMWLMDEAHMLTPEAQNAFLKILEDPPRHCYFVLATTEPNKLKKTVQTRCTQIVMRPLKPADMKTLLERVVGKESKLVKSPLTEEVYDAIINAADGSAREALVKLEQVIGLKSEEARLSAIQSSGKTQTTHLGVLLLTGAKWGVIKEEIKKMDDEPERIRRGVLTIAMNAMLAGGKNCDRAATIITAFSLPFFDTGKPGLALAAYEVCK